MAAKVAAEVAPRATSFVRGGKELHLPDFTISLCRAKLPASFAKFHVPLWFSKLDLRDYLFHAYNVRIFGVRSYVKQSRPTQGHPSLSRQQPRRWRRPRSIKYMTVELERPFEWPEEPEDLSPWNKAQSEMARKEQERLQDTMQRDADARFDKRNAESMREQAEALLKGKAKWTPSADKQLWKMMTRRAP